jgi:hypothetical protein
VHSVGTVRTPYAAHSGLAREKAHADAAIRKPFVVADAVDCGRVPIELGADVP